MLRICGISRSRFGIRFVASVKKIQQSEVEFLNLFEAQYARVLDSRRKFIEAAHRYYELSLKSCLSSEDQEAARQNALQCTLLASAGSSPHRRLTVGIFVLSIEHIIDLLYILSVDVSLLSFYSAGQQRSRMLATLFKDERCQCLPSYAILEKMYLDRIIKRSELNDFEANLKQHQKAMTADGR